MRTARMRPSDGGDAPCGPHPVEAVERRPDVLEGLWNVIVGPKRRPGGGSYVRSLLKSAPERVVRKVVENSALVRMRPLIKPAPSEGNP